MSDDLKISAAFISGGLALCGTIYVAILNYLSHRELAHFKAGTEEKLARLNDDLQAKRDDRLAKQETEKIVSKFRDPLLHAAYDLQSRIYNILRQDFLGVYYTKGTDREKEYAVDNTIFLIAQYLGWTELIRQEIQFLDLGEDDETRKLRTLQDGMYTQLRTDKVFGKGFRLFAGEQRAVGELMIDRGGETTRCIGYAKFLKDKNQDLDRWLQPLRDDVQNMAANPVLFEGRLVAMQHSLIDLLEFLDPGYVYFPIESRGKI